MSEWFGLFCQRLTPEAEFTLGAMSVILALLVLVTIALGFGPLRAWLGMVDTRRSPLRRSVDSDGGLLSIWRLYRQMLPTDPSTAVFCMPAVPGLIVRDDVGDTCRASGAGENELPTDLPDGRPMTETSGLLPTFEQTKLM